MDAMDRKDPLHNIKISCILYLKVLNIDDSHR